VIVSDANQGLVAAWRNAWKPKERELAVILEDDAEVSVHWYRWLANMWLAYGGRDDIAAISLQKQTMKAQVAGVQDEDFTVDFPSILPHNPAFLYQLTGLGGSVGLSPHPGAWADFLSQHGDKMGSCPPGLNCPEKESWEYWWHHYAFHRHLFTLYLLHSKTFATQHREVGVHENGSGLKDVSPVENWELRWEAEKMPKRLPRAVAQCQGCRPSTQSSQR